MSGRSHPAGPHRRRGGEHRGKLTKENLASIPRDINWIVTACLLAELCSKLADATTARILYRRLLPYASRLVVVEPGVNCIGSVSRYLGILAEQLEDWAAAERHFRRAIETNNRIGARPFLAHAKHEYAEMLLRRGQPGSKAVELVDEAIRIYEDPCGDGSREMPMKNYLEDARALKKKLDRNPRGARVRGVNRMSEGANAKHALSGRRRLPALHLAGPFSKDNR